jgi:DNA-binding GntR family transcriptional regulator
MNTMKFAVEPLDTGASFKTKAYAALKSAISQMGIYDHPSEIRLDERQLCEALGVSRTPVREAMALLEREGFVRSVPRRGIFVVRKTKREIIEMITVWAALESMAARLITERCTDAEILALEELFLGFSNGGLEDHLDEYSDANIQFHQSIIRSSDCQLIIELTENLFVHIRAIRKITMQQDNRAHRSLIEHTHIIDALKRRDADLAERLVRDHTLDLAAHVEKHCDFLD